MSDKDKTKVGKRGRPKGSLGKSDVRVKHAWAAFLEGRLKEIDRLYGKVEEEEGAAAALKILLDISKYAAPTTKVEREGGGSGGNYILNITTGIPAPPNQGNAIDGHAQEVTPNIPLPMADMKDEHEF